MNPSTQVRVTEINWLFAEGLRPTQIADRMGISRQRVHQIIGSVSRTRKLTPCHKCGTLFLAERGRVVCDTCRSKMLTTFKCTFCSKERTILTSAYKTRLKRNRNPAKGLLCSKSCHMSVRWENKRQYADNKKLYNKEPNEKRLP